ncbi:MAG: polysaccharide ABC transporter ATP-binding protein [Thermoanaerobaculia bacterium]
MTFAVRANELTKEYRLYDRPIDRLVERITRFPRHTVFPALQEVSFEVPPGGSLGLIGQNGAGKSTLLRLLTRVSQPTSGTIETRGSIASILELGTGFHPEFTGRANAELNAAILGLGPAEIRETLPEILEFSELGPFLDQPVKTYSSGMTMRLGFSVAVNVRPDILVIDEALAVGDGYFQKKCIDRIRELQRQGTTLVFCSHALYYVSMLCTETLWLESGTTRRQGPSLDVVHEYENFLLQRDRTVREAEPPVPHQPAEHSPVKVAHVLMNESTVSAATELRMRPGDPLEVRVGVRSKAPEIRYHVNVAIVRAADEAIAFSMSSSREGLDSFQGDADVTLRCSHIPLVRGEYAVRVLVSEPDGRVLDRSESGPHLQIEGDRFEVGLVSVDHQWTLESERELEP